MSDAQVMKAFGDPNRSLRLMRLGHEVEFLAGQQSEHNMLALAIWQAFYESQPVKKILEMILDYSHDNPPALTAMFGDELLNKIKTTLYED